MIFTNRTNIPTYRFNFTVGGPYLVFVPVEGQRVNGCRETNFRLHFSMPRIGKVWEHTGN
jgi:hypothetical protein